jgi:ribonuclease P protein component
MPRFASLRRQADFARLRRHGRRFSTKSLVIYCSDPLAGDASSLIGITVSKSIGKAVLRNQIRRRLAAIVRESLATKDAMRLLVVARPAAAETSFADLHAEVTSALGRV